MISSSRASARERGVMRKERPRDSRSRERNDSSTGGLIAGLRVTRGAPAIPVPDEGAVRPVGELALGCRRSWIPREERRLRVTLVEPVDDGVRVCATPTVDLEHRKRAGDRAPTCHVLGVIGHDAFEGQLLEGEGCRDLLGEGVHPLREEADRRSAVAAIRVRHSIPSRRRRALRVAAAGRAHRSRSGPRPVA